MLSRKNFSQIRENIEYCNIKLRFVAKKQNKNKLMKYFTGLWKVIHGYNF